MKNRCLFAILFFLLMPAIVHAGIIIEPSNPTISDNVKVTVSGLHNNPCFEISSSSNIVGNSIEISVHIVEKGDICAQVITPWSVTKELGPLAMGGYEVTANIIGGVRCSSGCIEKASFSSIKKNSGPSVTFNGVADVPNPPLGSYGIVNRPIHIFWDENEGKDFGLIDGSLISIKAPPGIKFCKANNTTISVVSGALTISSIDGLTENRITNDMKSMVSISPFLVNNDTHIKFIVENVSTAGLLKVGGSTADDVICMMPTDASIMNMVESKGLPLEVNVNGGHISASRVSFNDSINLLLRPNLLTAKEFSSTELDVMFKSEVGALKTSQFRIGNSIDRSSGVEPIDVELDVNDLRKAKLTMPNSFTMDFDKTPSVWISGTSTEANAVSHRYDSVHASAEVRNSTTKPKLIRKAASDSVLETISLNKETVKAFNDNSGGNKLIARITSVPGQPLALKIVAKSDPRIEAPLDLDNVSIKVSNVSPELMCEDTVKDDNDELNKDVVYIQGLYNDGDIDVIFVMGNHPTIDDGSGNMAFDNSGDRDGLSALVEPAKPILNGERKMVRLLVSPDGFCGRSVFADFIIDKDLHGIGKFVSSRAVAKEGNVAEEDVTTGRVETLGSRSSDIELVADPDENKHQVVGIRFPNIKIPHGSIIEDAYIQFISDEKQEGPVTITLRGEANDNAELFMENFSNISGRQMTNASVNWSPGGWGRGDSGERQKTPNLVSIIQEIVDMPGWRFGNAMAFIISSRNSPNHRTAENGANNGPVLTIMFRKTKDKFFSGPAVAKEGNVAEEDLSTGGVETLGSRSSDIELTTDSDENKEQVVGLRFPNIEISQGALIKDAYIQFVSDENQNGPVTITLHGEANDNADQFQETSGNVSSRQGTKASVNWNPGAWSTGDSSDAQKTPSLASIVQEIVDIPGWKSGNAMTFIVSSKDLLNHRTAENSDTNGPVLFIELESESPRENFGDK